MNPLHGGFFIVMSQAIEHDGIVPCVALLYC